GLEIEDRALLAALEKADPGVKPFAAAARTGADGGGDAVGATDLGGEMGLVLADAAGIQDVGERVGLATAAFPLARVKAGHIVADLEACLAWLPRQVISVQCPLAFVGRDARIDEV